MASNFMEGPGRGPHHWLNAADHSGGNVAAVVIAGFMLFALSAARHKTPAPV